MSAGNAAAPRGRYRFTEWTLTAMSSMALRYVGKCLTCAERSKDESDPDAAQLWCLKHAGRTHHSGYELTLVQQFNATVTTPPTIPPAVLRKVPVPDDLAVALARCGETLPPEDFSDGQLASSVAKTYQRELRGLPRATELAQLCRELLNDEEGEGFIVLQLARLQDASTSTAHLSRALTGLLALIATPLSVLDGRPLWHTTDAIPSHVPLHLDIPNSTWPPDYTALLCVRPDPRGQGHCLVSHARRAVSRLGESEAELLTHQRYGNGSFKGLAGVGVEWRRFPAIDGMATRGGYVRFAPSMLGDADPGDPYARAVQALERELIAGQRNFQLDPGELLIVNQHLCCYGRAPLGEGQEGVPEGTEQLILRSFLRRQGRPP